MNSGFYGFVGWGLPGWIEGEEGTRFQPGCLRFAFWWGFKPLLGRVKFQQMRLTIFDLRFSVSLEISDY
jgi:hypothetical protein